MPWIIGIDEAGYGPNLGPLVMTSVACHVPDRLADTDLGRLLGKVVRRYDDHEDREDGRLLVDDSKLVYSTAQGLACLEASVTAALSSSGEPDCTLETLLNRLCPAHVPELKNEPWYTGTRCLPAENNLDELSLQASRFAECSKNQEIHWGPVHSALVGARQFNNLLDHWGSKGAVLGHALTGLLEKNQVLGESSDPLYFFIDKHGGRNNYAAMLQQAFPNGLVLAREESMARSVYSVCGLHWEVRLTIQPRADAEHFCVALASMVSKYIRELLMLEFNGFWQSHVPELKPTAGYPGDAARFFEEIQPIAARLGIAEEKLWRRR